MCLYGIGYLFVCKQGGENYTIELLKNRNKHNYRHSIDSSIHIKDRGFDTMVRGVSKAAGREH